MGLFLSLKYISELAPGRYEFRRRIPESAKAVLGQAEFKRVFSAASPSAIAREHARIMGEFNRLVASAKTGGVSGAKTPREAAEAHLRRAAELLSGVSGARDDDERREILADALIESGADAGLYRAVVLPDAPLPGHTLEDARKLYVKEKLNGGEGVDEQKAAARVERVFARVRKALGKRAETCTLEDLKREDARKVRDHMLASPKQGGGTLSAASVRRELNILSAIVSYGIKEFDLRGKVSNPFEGLEIRKSQGAAPESEADKRDPLPASVVAAMRGRLTDEPDLIWRLLVGTGCRLAEVVGLRVEDIVLADDLPFVRVAWHEERRLKTSASIRVVPLVGDALEAATDAVRLPRKGKMVFERYARPRGVDAASQNLMKHLRKVTRNPRHVLHSLRHNMKDDLRRAGAEKVVQDLILGHASSSVGERYGGEAARLEVAHRAMKAALSLREDAVGRVTKASTGESI